MRTVNRILVPTDFSNCSNDALLQAVALAKVHDARLDVLHVLADVDDPLRVESYGEQQEDVTLDVLRAEADTQMHAVLSSLPVDTVAVRRVQAVGDPCEAILNHAEAETIDLIVLGTHGRKGVSRWVLGSVAEMVVRKAACSVLVVRQKRQRTTDLRRIGVAIDLSEQSRPVLEQAIGLARENGARLDVLHVIEPFAVPVSLTGIATLSDLVPDIEDKIRERIHWMMDAAVKTPFPYELVIQEGHPVHVLTEYAENNRLDLIVMGTHGNTGLTRFLLGSVAERVLRYAPCPVFIAKTRETEAEEPLAHPATERFEMGEVL